MSLYGRTDSNANIAKAALALGCAYSNEYDVYFVDETEAQLAENKERGITGPGYWAYLQYTDADGNTRRKSELIVALGGADTNANETQADDDILADESNTITISQDVSDFTGAPDPTVNADFTVAVTVTNSGSAIYQWQKQTPTGTRWTNITNGGVYSGATTNELLVNGADKATYDGYKFRVKVTSDNGAEEVISATGTLTFA